MIETSIVQNNTRSFIVIISPPFLSFVSPPVKGRLLLVCRTNPGPSYVSVVVLERPEQLLSESVQAGRHREGHDSAPASSRLGLRASLDSPVVSRVASGSLDCLASQEAQLGDEGGALSPSRRLEKCCEAVRGLWCLGLLSSIHTSVCKRKMRRNILITLQPDCPDCLCGADISLSPPSSQPL